MLMRLVAHGEHDVEISQYHSALLMLTTAAYAADLTVTVNGVKNSSGSVAAAISTPRPIFHAAHRWAASG